MKVPSLHGVPLGPVCFRRMVLKCEDGFPVITLREQYETNARVSVQAISSSSRAAKLKENDWKPRLPTMQFCISPFECFSQQFVPSTR